MTKTWCVGGRHCSNTVNEIVFEKVNRKTEKLAEIFEGTCSICGRKKSQIFS